MAFVVPDYHPLHPAADSIDLTGLVYKVLAGALANDPTRVDQATALLNGCVVDVNALATFLSTDSDFLKQFRFISALAFVDPPRTLGEAIIHLGIDRTRNIALACFLLDRFTSSGGATPKAQRAFVFADACWSVAGLIEIEQPEQAYIAGLLSTLGYLPSGRQDDGKHPQLSMMLRMAELAISGVPSELATRFDPQCSMEEAHTWAAERSVADFLSSLSYS